MKAVILERPQSHQSPPPTPCLSRGAASPTASSLSLQIQGCSFWAQALLLGSGSVFLQVAELTSVMQLQNPRAQILNFFLQMIKHKEQLASCAPAQGSHMRLQLLSVPGQVAVGTMSLWLLELSCCELG